MNEINSNTSNNISLCNSNIQQRHRTTPTQSQFLESYFQNIDDFPDSNMREKIAQKLSMPSKSVHIWFQNRRAKRKQEERTRLEQAISFIKSPQQIATLTEINVAVSQPPQRRQQQQNISYPLSMQQQHNLTNFASLKLPPLRNLVEGGDKAHTQGSHSSEDVILPPLHLAIPQILLGNHNTYKCHVNNCRKTSTNKPNGCATYNDSATTQGTSRSIYCPSSFPFMFSPGELHLSRCCSHHVHHSYLYRFRHTPSLKQHNLTKCSSSNTVSSNMPSSPSFIKSGTHSSIFSKNNSCKRDCHGNCVRS